MNVSLKTGMVKNEKTMSTIDYTDCQQQFKAEDNMGIGYKTVIDK